MKRNLQKTILILLLSFAAHGSLWAQPTGFEDDLSDTPIDGGIALLVAAGLGYGLKKTNFAKKSRD